MATKNQLTDEARKARNEYRRAWAKKNPDKIQAQQAKYWAKKAKAAAGDKLGGE